MFVCCLFIFLCHCHPRRALSFTQFAKLSISDTKMVTCGAVRVFAGAVSLMYIINLFISIYSELSCRRMKSLLQIFILVIVVHSFIHSHHSSTCQPTNQPAVRPQLIICAYNSSPFTIHMPAPNTIQCISCTVIHRVHSG